MGGVVDTGENPGRVLEKRDQDRRSPRTGEETGKQGRKKAEEVRSKKTGNGRRERGEYEKMLNGKERNKNEPGKNEERARDSDRPKARTTQRTPRARKRTCIRAIEGETSRIRQVRHACLNGRSCMKFGSKKPSSKSYPTTQQILWEDTSSKGPGPGSPGPTRIRRARTRRRRCSTVLAFSCCPRVLSPTIAHYRRYLTGV